MVIPPPHDDQGQPERWTGRASVSTPSGHGESHVEPESGERPVSPPPVGAAVFPTPIYGKKRLRPRWGRIALIAVLSLILVAGLVGLATFLWISGVNDNLKRTDPFADIAGRPPKVANGTVNILMLGTDSRDPDAPIDTASKWRTDTIVLMHIPASQDKAYLISFPRDLYVHVPPSKDGQFGDTMAKINAAYAWGGEPLMVQTVEEYTGVHIDHVALIDFGGFIKVTDAVGGVDMNIERDITSIHKPFRKFTKGMNHLDGAEALDYIRQREQFPDGDFARMRHQQQFLKALMDKAASGGTVANPFKLKAFITSVADAMTVDQDFSLLDMAWQFKGLKSENLVFLTSPHNGTDNIDGQSIVVSDREKALGLYDAVTKDTVTDWLSRNPQKQGSGG
jgi:LCP family protein required for cell wall assembly